MKISNASGIEIVLEAMNQHNENRNLCEEGCGLLRNMATEENVMKITSIRGIEIVLKVMNQHIKSGGICKNGCGVLKNVTTTC